MKKILILLLYLFNVLYIYADDEYILQESILFERGYIKFDPSEYFYIDILMDCYREIFNRNWGNDGYGVSHIFFNNDDGFLYSLFYLYGEEMANLLVIVYLNDGEKDYGYYKMNYNLDGIEIQTTYGRLLVFL